MLDVFLEERETSFCLFGLFWQFFGSMIEFKLTDGLPSRLTVSVSLWQGLPKIWCEGANKRSKEALHRQHLKTEPQMNLQFNSISNLNTNSKIFSNLILSQRILGFPYACRIQSR